MRLVTFETGEGHHFGAVDGDTIADVTAVDPGLGPDLGAVLASGRLGDVGAASARAPRLPRDGVVLASPVRRPPKFLAIGLNYAKHVAESGMDAPAHQLWFNKQSTCAIGTGAPIHVPMASAGGAYAGGLAVVNRRPCPPRPPAPA